MFTAGQDRDPSLFPPYYTLSFPLESWQSSHCSLCMYTSSYESGLKFIYSSGLLKSFLLWQYNQNQIYIKIISTINIVAHIIPQRFFKLTVDILFQTSEWIFTSRDGILKGWKYRRKIRSKHKTMHPCNHEEGKYTYLYIEIFLVFFAITLYKSLSIKLFYTEVS